VAINWTAGRSGVEYPARLQQVSRYSAPPQQRMIQARTALMFFLGLDHVGKGPLSDITPEGVYVAPMRNRGISSLGGFFCGGGLG